MSKIEVLAQAATGKPTNDVGDAVVDVALNVAQTGVPMVGPIGYVAGVPFSFLVADRDAQKKLVELAENPVIRSQVAAQLGIPEVAVNPQMLLIAAQQNESLQLAVQAIDEKRSSHVKENAAGIAGMAAAVGTLAAVTTGPVGWLAGGVAAAAGAFLGEGIGAKVFGADGNLNPMSQVEKIRELRAAGAPIREIAAAVFSLRVSQNPALQEGIVHRMGTPYFELDAEGKQSVMAQSAGLGSACLYDAEMLLRYPQSEPEYLMFGNMPDPQQPAVAAPQVVAEFAEAGVREFSAPPSEGVLPENGFAAREIARGNGPRAAGVSMAQMIDRQREAAASPGSMLQ